MLTIRNVGRAKLYKDRRKILVYMSADEFERLRWESQQTGVPMTQILRLALVRHFAERGRQ